MQSLLCIYTITSNDKMEEAAPYDMYKINVVTEGDSLGGGTYGSVYKGSLSFIQYNKETTYTFDPAIAVAVKVEKTNENIDDLLWRVNPLLAKLGSAESFLKNFLPLIHNPNNPEQQLYPLYASDPQGEVVYSVMGVIKMDLFTYIQKIQSIPFHIFGQLCAQIINMVQAAEVSGYLYTDLKIENIGVILQDDMLPKLVFLDLDSFIEYKSTNDIPERFPTTFSVFRSKEAKQGFLETLKSISVDDRKKAVQIHHITGVISCIAQILIIVNYKLQDTDTEGVQLENAINMVRDFEAYLNAKETKLPFTPGERLEHIQAVLNSLDRLVQSPLGPPKFVDRTQTEVISTDLIEPPNLPRIRSFCEYAQKTVASALAAITDEKTDTPQWLSCFAHF